MDNGNRHSHRRRVSGLNNPNKNMAYVKAIAEYLPDNIKENPADSKLTKKTGIYKRHVVRPDECASDLAYGAAEYLFSKFSIDRKAIDFIILCTQSPDYFLPTTACILQHRLSLGKNCGAFDFNLGCSGYVYGLSMAKGLIETGQAENVLLLTAETYTKYIREDDSATEPLFGDGACATIVSGADKSEEGIYGFDFGTNGEGAESLIVKTGASRFPRDPDSAFNSLYMHGGEIAQFALDVAPATMTNILRKCEFSKEDIDYFVFHQANKFMLNFLREKCELMNDPFWNDVENYGNTVSTTIPLALVDLISSHDTKNLKKVMLIGFGAGLSWGGCVVDLSEFTTNV